MSERIIINCDKCGKESPTPVRLRVGYDSDAVVGGTTTVFETVDLCPECCVEVVKEWKAKRL